MGLPSSLVFASFLLCFETIFVATAPHHDQLLHQSTSSIPRLVKSPEQGGPNGSPYDDYKSTNSTIVGVRSIYISFGDLVDSIQITYLLASGGLYTAPKRGTDAKFNDSTVIALAPDEYIEKIEGKSNGLNVGQLTITTMRPKNYERTVYGPFGKIGTLSFMFEGYIVGFFGKDEQKIDSIGVYTLTPLEKKLAFPGEGGNEFDENPDMFVPPASRINRLLIRHGDSLDSIQVEYQLLNGSMQLGKMHGGDGGNLTIINLDKQQIIGLECKTQYRYVDQLSLTTKYDDGSTAVYGPFGRLGSQSYSAYGNVLGFYGRDGALINGIGIYYF